MAGVSVGSDPCDLDFLALGALVHRLDPGVIPFRKARTVDIHVSGGEYNVAAGLADCFGLRAGMATAMVRYPLGDLVQARLGWQTHPTIPGRYLQKLDLALGTMEDWIGPLGLSAVTAYFGMRDVGGLRPDDRVLVSAAALGSTP